MEFSRPTLRVFIFPLFIAVSLLVGLLIPDFYTWTNSNQSRRSPLLWQVPLCSAIVAVALCLALPWLPITFQPPSDTARPRMQFSLGALLLLTAGIAVIIALLVKFPPAMSAIACAGAYAFFVAFCVRNPQHRMALTLLACMYLPYIWLFGYVQLNQFPLAEFALIVPNLPTFILAALYVHNLDNMLWLAYPLTALELTVGIWMIRLGPKRTIAYLLLVMHISMLGSIFFREAVLT